MLMAKDRTHGAARAGRDITKSDMARAMRVTAAELDAIGNGSAALSVDRAVRAAKSLGLPLWALLDKL